MEISKSAKKERERDEEEFEDFERNEYPDIYSNEPTSGASLKRKIINMDLEHETDTQKKNLFNQ